MNFLALPFSAAFIQAAQSSGAPEKVLRTRRTEHARRMGWWALRNWDMCYTAYCWVWELSVPARRARELMTLETAFSDRWTVGG